MWHVDNFDPRLNQEERRRVEAAREALGKPSQWILPYFDDGYAHDIIFFSDRCLPYFGKQNAQYWISASEVVPLRFIRKRGGNGIVWLPKKQRRGPCTCMEGQGIHVGRRF